MACADWQFNLPEGVTESSREIYHLHMMTFWVCVAIGVVVFGTMAVALFKYRKSKGAVAATFHENTKAEIIWTVIPVIILISLAIPTAKALFKIEDSSNADMTIKVTGYQWRWEYEYPEEGIRFFSNLDAKSREASALGSGIDPASVDHYLREVDNPLVMPVGKKVRFLFTANDVIHSWWVPELGIKKDAIPGFVNDMWAKVNKPGVYRGQCAELCGKGHGFMPIKVVAMELPEYKQWVARQQQQAAATAAAGNREWSKTELMASGEKIFTSTCAACHQVTGLGIPGVFPALKGSKIVTGDLSAHLGVVLNGRPGTAMQAFGKQLSDADIASVITYERNAFGNNTGDVVQPAMVKAARQ
jgi:cytochrome c oxidase subunit 2